MSVDPVIEPNRDVTPFRRATGGNRRRSVFSVIIERTRVSVGRFQAIAILLSPYFLLYALLWSGYLWKMVVAGSDVAAGQAGATILWSVPDAKHWFGIDGEGRDLLVRSLRAGASTASTALLSSILGIGLALLVIAPISLLGRDAVRRTMRLITRLTSCFPALFLALVFAAGVGAGFWPTLFILAGIIMLHALSTVVRWMQGVENDGHVISTRVLGLKRWQVLKTAVWPLLWPRLVAYSASVLPAAVLAESVLSFAGFGIGSRNIESLGTVIADGRALMFEAPWLVIYPGIALTLIAVSLASLGWIFRSLIAESTNPRLF